MLRSSLRRLIASTSQLHSSIAATAGQLATNECSILVAWSSSPPPSRFVSPFLAWDHSIKSFSSSSARNSNDNDGNSSGSTSEPTTNLNAAALPADLNLPPLPVGYIPTPAEADAALDAWGKAMDKGQYQPLSCSCICLYAPTNHPPLTHTQINKNKNKKTGDWETAWTIFESHFPVDTPVFPKLEDLLAWDPDEEDKAVRREREAALQEESARSRQRKVDTMGRAHGVGKRKTSIARVWIRQGPGHMMINRRPYDAYFPELGRRNDVLAPFLVTDTLGKFDMMAAVEGGGHTGQAQALRHGLARALQNWDPELRMALKTAGLLTRDARIVERKKPGRKKARKSFAFVKR